MNATRAATIRGRAWVAASSRSADVQTPTLGLIVKREREIRRVVRAVPPDPRDVPAPYQGLWFEGERNADLRDLSRADAIVAKVSRPGWDDREGRAEEQSSARLLYDLTSLQR